MARKLSAYNVYMKKALKGKMKGKTKAQRLAIFRAAAKGWKGGGSKSRAKRKTTSARPRTSRNPVRVKRRMARKKKSRRRGFLSTSTIFKFVRLGALVLPAAIIATKPGLATPQKIRWGVRNYFGVDTETGKLSLGDLVNGWGPFVMSNIITWGVQKLAGIFRRL